MKDSLSLEIKNEETNRAGSLYGRDNELNKLVRILADKMGSATLISGDRGSGKTSTIKEAINRLTPLKRKQYETNFAGLGAIMAITRIHVIHVDVPLVPNNTESDGLRKSVLRLIVQSLVSEYRSKNFFYKLLYPVTYSSKLHRLENLLLYKSVVRKTSQSIKGQRHGFSANLGSSTQYEYDLAYADIELNLKDFFMRFSKVINFVIVFDELDKYFEEEDGSNSREIKPHQYIKELKNLFTVSSAKFIFTSIEEYYQEVNDELRTNVLSLSHYKFNLFTNKILINQLSPDEYIRFLRGLFSVDIDAMKPLARRENDIFEQNMMWHTNGYPFMSKKIISNLATYRDNGTSYIDLLTINNEFSTSGTSAPALQYTVNKIYLKYSNRNELVNRYLYKSLRKVADVLYSGREIKVNKSNLMAIIYVDVDLGSDTARTILYGTEYNPRTPLDFPSSEETRWETQLQNLDTGARSMINEAITDLVWHLDYLDIAVADQQDTEQISEVGIYLNKYYDDELQSVIKKFDTVDEQHHETEERLETLFKKMKSVEFNTGIDTSLPAPLTLGYDGRAASGMELTKGWQLKSMMEEEIKNLKQHQTIVNTAIVDKFMANLMLKFSRYHIESQALVDSTERALPTKMIRYNFRGKKVNILFNPSNELIRHNIEDKEIEKTILVFGANKKDSKKVKNSKKLKYFYFSSDRYTDFSSVFESVKEYIEKRYI